MYSLLFDLGKWLIAAINIANCPFSKIKIQKQIAGSNPSMKTIAQLTYIPLYTDHPREKVQDLLEFVAQHDVEVDVNYLSTSVKGNTESVFELIREIYDTQALEEKEFRFHVELLSPIEE